MILWYCDIVILRYCDIMILLYCDIVILFYCAIDDIVGHLSISHRLSPLSLARSLSNPNPDSKVAVVCKQWLTMVKIVENGQNC